MIVRTVLGDIAPGELGGCDAHERDVPNELVFRNPTLMDASARATTHLSTGHAEGFAETFRELYRGVYRAVAGRAGKSGSEYPTFRAGHVENASAKRSPSPTETDDGWR